MDLETLRRIVFEDDVNDKHHTTTKRRIGESATIALHDLKSRDLVPILDRKIYRAHQGEVIQLKILFNHNTPKASRIILDFLAESPLVASYFIDEQKQGIIWADLLPKKDSVH